jgi:hypothetical protein
MRSIQTQNLISSSTLAVGLQHNGEAQLPHPVKYKAKERYVTSVSMEQVCNIIDVVELTLCCFERTTWYGFHLVKPDINIGKRGLEY